MADPGKHVGLFVTCLVDLIRPSVGFAAVKLLQDAGCSVGREGSHLGAEGYAFALPCQ
jgi:Fe-S oxidoreductase